MGHLIWPNKGPKIKQKKKNVTTSGQFHSWNLDVKLMPAFIGIQIIICQALASVTMCDQDANGECCQLAAKYIKCQPLPPNYQMT